MRELIEVAATAVVAVTSLVGYAPQLMRTWRHRDATGLSPTALLVVAVCFLLGPVYAAAGGAWLLASANLLGLSMVAALMVACHRAGMRFASSWRPAATLLAAVTIASLFGYATFGYALAVLSVVSWVPEVWPVWTQPRITGVSVASWFVIGLDSACYLTLGVLGYPFGVLAAGLAGSAATLAVFAALLVRTDARRPASTGPGTGGCVDLVAGPCPGGPAVGVPVTP